MQREPEMRKSSSSVNLRQNSSNFNSNRRSSIENPSVILKAEKYKQPIKKVKSLECLEKMKQSALDVVKANATGFIYEVMKDGSEHMDGDNSPYEMFQKLVHDDIGSIMVNHVTEGSIISIVSHATKHHI